MRKTTTTAPAFAYVETDDADIEHTHLWVSIMDHDGGTIEIIEWYPIERAANLRQP